MNLPSVAFDAAPLRRRIIAAYWLVFLLGIPLWWITTSIERLALPSPSAYELRFPVRIELDGYDLAKRVGAALEQEKRDNPAPWRGLDVVVESPRERRSQKRESAYRVELHPPQSGEQPSLWLSDRTLHVRTAQDSNTPGLHKTIASALSGLLAQDTSHPHLVARYAPRYRLAFSLLNEDASAGHAALRWDVRGAIQRYLTPTLAQLGILHNFTVESQVQFHAPLAFVPPQNDAGEYLLGEEELKMFINSADWTLASSVTEDPVLHFILFVPSATRRPLKVHTSRETNAFIVPQWGGVVILPDGSNSTSLSFSDLTHPFHTFRTQLLSLLGLPPFPPGVSAPGRGLLNTWQLDVLLRRRALENTYDSTEALTSIGKLVEQIANMPVGQDVRGDVQGALDAIVQVHASAAASPRDTLRHSARANTLSSRAFFNPGMLALLYFPAEHKYAVYIPLFMPATLPLVAAAIREFKRWRMDRKAEREKVE